MCLTKINNLTFFRRKLSKPCKLSKTINTNTSNMSFACDNFIFPNTRYTIAKSESISHALKLYILSRS